MRFSIGDGSRHSEPVSNIFLPRSGLLLADDGTWMIPGALDKLRAAASRVMPVAASRLPKSVPLFPIEDAPAKPAPAAPKPAPAAAPPASGDGDGAWWLALPAAAIAVATGVLVVRRRRRADGPPRAAGATG